jgi:uncharacterized protein YgiM (DUF1202 family)
MQILRAGEERPAQRQKSTTRERIIAIALVCVISLGIASVSPIAASAAPPTIAWGAATVDCNLLNVRSGAGTNFDVVAQLGENTIVVVVEKGDEWFYINYNGILGYSKAEYFKDILTAENFDAKGIISDDGGVRLRERPGTDQTVLGTYNKGREVTIIGINTGWYKVKTDGKTGYIRSDLIELTGGTSTQTYSSAAYNSSGSKIADFALQFVGYKYVYGAQSPSVGFDCSGLVWYTFQHFGVTVSRGATSQYNNNGVRVSKSELQPGDLLFFADTGAGITHVGIYIGDQQFVHASNSRVGVIVSRLDSSYYIRVYYGAKRVSI